MFMFYAVHYPMPEKEELLIQSMHQFAGVIEKQPGIIFVNPYPFRDAANGALLGVAIWESREAFEAAMSALERAFPSEEWEIRPREVFGYDSAI
jgi:hypothetical protein